MRSVLVIEDSVEFANFLADALEELELKPFVVSKPSDANFKLRNQEFKFVLLDLNLDKGTKGDGIVSAMRSRKDNLNYATPVIVVSGSIDKERALSLAGTVQGFLVKPFGVEALKERLLAMNLI